MYISTNVSEKQTNLSLLSNLSDRTRFGMPNWKREFNELRSIADANDIKIFYSGPLQFSRALKKQGKKLNIMFKKGSF